MLSSLLPLLGACTKNDIKVVKQTKQAEFLEMKAVLPEAKAAKGLAAAELHKAFHE